MDTQLKSGNKEWSDEELDKLLDRIMVLFRYIHGKSEMSWGEVGDYCYPYGKGLEGYPYGKGVCYPYRRSPVVLTCVLFL